MLIDTPRGPPQVFADLTDGVRDWGTRGLTRAHWVDCAAVGMADMTELQALDRLLSEIVVAGGTDAPQRICEACVAALPVDRAALTLMSGADRQQPLWASDSVARELDELQFSLGEGPCVEAFVDRRPVLVADLTETADDRWPVFAATARRTPSRPIAAPDLRETSDWPRFSAHTLESGYRSVHALPMRLRNETIGALNLFRVEPGALEPEELHIAQALADVATIGILQERSIRRREVVAEQLQVALNSRVIIEQAKGVLAERGQLDMNRAFQLIRGYARSTNQLLSVVALSIVNGTTTAEALIRPLHGSTSP